MFLLSFGKYGLLGVALVFEDVSAKDDDIDVGCDGDENDDDDDDDDDDDGILI